MAARASLIATSIASEPPGGEQQLGGVAGERSKLGAKRLGELDGAIAGEAARRETQRIELGFDRRQHIAGVHSRRGARCCRESPCSGGPPVSSIQMPSAFAMASRQGVDTDW